MPIVVTESIQIPDSDVDIAYSRSGGPGGQHVNKVSSKVQLRFHLQDCEVLADDVKTRIRAYWPNRLTEDGDFLVQSEQHRDQKQNLSDAQEKLADLIRAALVPPKPRKKTKPSKVSVRRRLAEKGARGKTKQARGRVHPED